ncbi:MAG: hypothetical protein R3C20_15000 [Planctomycetaceae bacterium]
MRDEFLRTLYITTTFDTYCNFFSDDWGERIDRLTARKPKLSEIAFDLMMEWRAAAYTASLPVTILEHMKAFHDGFVNTGELNTNLLRLASPSSQEPAAPNGFHGFFIRQQLTHLHG